MRASVRHPPRQLHGPTIRRPSRALAGEKLAGKIVEDIRRQAVAGKLDPDRVMLDVLVGLVAELSDAPRQSHQPVELADLVQDAVEAARMTG